MKIYVSPGSGWQSEALGWNPYTHSTKIKHLQQSASVVLQLNPTAHRNYERKLLAHHHPQKIADRPTPPGSVIERLQI